MSRRRVLSESRLVNNHWYDLNDATRGFIKGMLNRAMLLTAFMLGLWTGLAIALCVFILGISGLVR